MGEGTKQDKNVPDGVIVWAVVVGKEVGSRCIGQPLSQKQPQSHWCQQSYHRFCYENYAPPHNEIDSQRESRPATHRKDFIEGTAYHHHPLKSKHNPTQPPPYYTNEDGRIGTGYHYVDADMVALAQSPLQAFPMHPVIDGAAKEHEEHSEQETDDAKHHLPTDICRQPHQPDGTQGKDGAAQVRPGVA